MGDAGVAVESALFSDSLLNDLSELAVTDFKSDLLISTQTHAGAAPIKKEFLLSNIEPIPIPEPTPVGKAPIAVSVDVETSQPQPAKEKDKRKKGMNKNRRKEMAQMTSNVRASGARLCPSAYMNVKCKHGDRCTSFHDVSEFMKTKPSDLGDICPVYEQRGFCPFSYSCRYGKAHISEDLTQTKKDIDVPYLQTVNAKNMHIQVAMRKRKYDFSRSMKFLETLPDCYFNRKGARSSAPSAADFSTGDGSSEVPLVVNDDVHVDQNENGETKVGSMEQEKRRIRMEDLAGKKYVAPLTTVGNLPFRRICVDLGADVTCGEMALATSILGGMPSEFSLVKRHPSEKIFGVQLAGGFADTMTMAAQILVDEFDIDFIDINMGCPIDVVNQKGGGCSLPTRPTKLYDVMRGMRSVMGSVPLTVKLRTGMKEGVLTADETIANMVKNCRPDMFTLHPRSKEQRYSKLARWDFVPQCVKAADNVPFFVCGDVLSWQEYYQRLETEPVAGVMIARGALIKPWLMTEIDEKRDWDITASERLDLLKKFVWYGLDHWGSDDCGVEKTRRFLLEWLSFTCRYIPVGLLERLPQQINERPPYYRGRNEMETLLSSQRSSDWVKISEMFLGPCPDGFQFIPKHKASSY